jgi:Ankyrin repeat
LYYASEGGYEKIAQMLLDKGADVQAQGYLGTVLQVASKGCYEKVIKVLILLGAYCSTVTAL